MESTVVAALCPEAGPPSGPSPKLISVHVDVDVPLCVLGEADCDMRLAHPPSRAPLGCGPVIEFKVPPGSPELCILNVPVKRGEDTQTVLAYLPANAGEGDTLRMVQRVDGSWRMTKKTTDHAVLLRAGYAAGHEVKIQVPDGSMLMFHVPEGSSPGDIVDLQRQEDSWMLQRVRVLPALDKITMAPNPVEGPYTALLRLLLEKGYLRRLPLDKDGLLHVSVPFCAGFLEITTLSNFFAEHCLQLPGVSGIRVLATELFDNYSLVWALAERWCRQAHPKIELKTRVQDLSADPLPDAGLTLALHPEATKGGPWFGIVASLIRSSVGLCVFTTFFDHEKQTVVNMADMYRKQAGEAEGTVGMDVEAMENPYYQAHEGKEGPPIRHIVLVPGPSLRPH